MIKLEWLDSSKVTELELERMREVVRPWLEVTNTETGGQSGHTNFIFTASSPACLAIEVTLSLMIYANFKEQFPRTKNSSPS